MRFFEVLFVAFVATILIPLSACSQTKTVSWKEETRLHSGQVIIVERTQEYRKVLEGIRTGWLFSSARIRATLGPSNQVVTWEATLQPIALDIAPSGEIYVVAVVAEMRGRKEYGLPDNAHHVPFKRDGNEWKRIPLGDVPRAFRPNLLVRTYHYFITQGSRTEFVDLALKEKLDSAPRLAPQFRGWPTQ